jgi:hypothetical protein
MPRKEVPRQEPQTAAVGASLSLSQHWDSITQHWDSITQHWDRITQHRDRVTQHIRTGTKAVSVERHDAMQVGTVGAVVSSTARYNQIPFYRAP